MSKIIFKKFGLLMFGIVLTIFHYFSLFHNFDIGIPKEVSAFGVIFILVGLLIVFRRPKEKGDENNMSSANGIGTTLYGKREIESDGSYIATKWFIFFLLPIFPISSYRVIPNTPKVNLITQVTNYSRFEKVPFNKKQVMNTYLLIYGFIFVFFVLPFLF